MAAPPRVPQAEEGQRRPKPHEEITFTPARHSQCDWWERRSGLERALAASCALLFVSCIVLLALHLVATEQLRWASSTIEEDTCYTIECIRAAAAILERANLSADPCVDFDAFACGAYERSHAVPDDHYHSTVLVSMQDDIFIRLQKLLEEPSIMNESVAVGKVRSLYQSCMNTSSVEEGSADILRDLLSDDEEGIGSWPVLRGSSWNAGHLHLERRLAMLRVHNVEPFFQLHVGQEERHNANPVYVLQMFSGSPVIRSEYYLNATDERSREFVRLYRDVMAQAVRLLGADPVTARADMDDLFDFEVQFANVTHTSDFDGGSSSGGSGASNDSLTVDSAMITVSLAELHNMAPELDWTFLFARVLKQAGLRLDELNLNVTVENDGGSYMRRLFELLNKTSPRTVANYLSWRFVMAYMPYLDVHFRRLYRDFRRRVPGAQDERTFLARWKECLRLLSDGFGLALASLFVHSDFPVQETDNEVSNLIKEIKKTYTEETLPRQSFLDDGTRELCREKIETMVQKVGFPKFILDSTQLDKEYDGLEVNEDHFLVNVLKLQRYEVAKELGKLTKPVDKDRDWVTSPLTVNAFYDFRGNYAMYPLGILRSPMLGLGRPMYLNYGTIGVVIGHEITHGFAGFGKKYDRHGNMSSWWSDEAIEQLRHRAECFVEQFSRFPLHEPGTYVNGNTTLEENVCDSTAVKQAYHSYKRWTSQHGQEPRLPGLGLSNEQVFFMQYAQIWCEVVSEEGYKRYETEPHSPGKHRSNGALQNSEEFSETFGCPVGSPMNPHKKCKFWD